MCRNAATLSYSKFRCRGIFVLAGIEFAASLFLNHPEWKLVFDTDGPLAEQTRRKIYDMAVADKMPIQGYHFPFPGRGYVEKSGSGYRLVPAMWNPAI